MMVKTCTKCGEKKPLDEFEYRHDRSAYRGACRDCRNTQKRNSESLNRETYLESKASYKRRNRSYETEFERRRRSSAQETSRLIATTRGKWSEMEDSSLLQEDGLTLYQKAVELGRTYESVISRLKRLKKEISYE